MTILCIDGMNFMHRARAGWGVGSAPLMFNFMRNFRSIVEKFNPNRIYFVLEGRSQQRKDILPEYKANRIAETGTAKHEELSKFFDQATEVISLLSSVFPVSVIKHPEYECDDTIYNIIKNSSTANEWVVVSNDSDFIQLLNEFQHVKLYNPSMKSFVETPDYDYVVWKSLRGDGSDNIKGIPGVGDKTALNAMYDPDLLTEILSKPENADIFERNHDLIKFITWSDDDTKKMISNMPIKNWDLVKQTFAKHEFNSLLKEGTWQKFISTFDHLFG
jgi:DNA polymerase-1